MADDSQLAGITAIADLNVSFTMCHTILHRKASPNRGESCMWSVKTYSFSPVIKLLHKPDAASCDPVVKQHVPKVLVPHIDYQQLQQ
jgi:hypothetical protein